MQIFLLELRIFINIYQGVIYVYMVDFHIADHNIVLVHLAFSKSLKCNILEILFIRNALQIAIFVV